jgi:choline dehydrogenase-like flavoprotein
VERGLEVFTEMGADAVHAEEIGETTPYLVHGTCRAGTDPDRSVLDEHCRAHEVRNLFVVDGSFMPTSGGAPPTLTILANSLRTADHILASAKGGRL